MIRQLARDAAVLFASHVVSVALGVAAGLLLLKLVAAVYA